MTQTNIFATFNCKQRIWFYVLIDPVCMPHDLVSNLSSQINFM